MSPSHNSEYFAAKANRKPNIISRLLQEDSGQDLIEYALLAALVGLAAITAMRGLSTKISTAFNSVGSNLTSAV